MFRVSRVVNFDFSKLTPGERGPVYHTAEVNAVHRESFAKLYEGRHLPVIVRLNHHVNLQVLERARAPQLLDVGEVLEKYIKLSASTVVLISLRRRTVDRNFATFNQL